MSTTKITLTLEQRMKFVNFKQYRISWKCINCDFIADRYLVAKEHKRRHSKFDRFYGKTI